MDDVYVVQIASTGQKGLPADAVAQVAVCRMMADGSDFDTVYFDTVSLDPLDLGKDALDFMSDSYGINAEDLYSGSDPESVAKGLQEVIYGKDCTSYNIGNVFGKYLSFEPWDCAREVTLLPSVSMRLYPELKGPPEKEHLLIRQAYDRLCPDDPADVGAGKNALDLAQMSVSVMMELRKAGFL